MGVGAAMRDEQIVEALRKLLQRELVALKASVRDHSENGITLAGVEQLIDQRIKELE